MFGTASIHVVIMDLNRQKAGEELDCVLLHGADTTLTRTDGALCQN